MIYKDISEQIEELRCKLHKELEKSGFDTKKALKISEELDELIEKFYVEKNMKKTDDKNNSLYKEYMIAYNKLKELLKNNGIFPTEKEWNNIAKNEKYLNSRSIKYVSKSSWGNLKKKINCEVKSDNKNTKI